MSRFTGKVSFESVDSNSRQREEAINAAYLVVKTCAVSHPLDLVRVNPYREILFCSNPNSRRDVEGATYVGELSGSLVTLAVRHYRKWHLDGKKYDGTFEFDLFFRDEAANTRRNIGDSLRKSILQAVRDVRKRC